MLNQGQREKNLKNFSLTWLSSWETFRFINSLRDKELVGHLREIIEKKDIRRR